MKRETPFRHEFVEFMPPQLEPGVLYVSVEYATASHLCACGCGMKVVTPITPTDWHLTFDGETISLHPSIGNWSYPCRSHYIIRRNRALWAGDMSAEDIARGRAHDRKAKERYFEPDERPAPPPVATPPAPKRKWWQRVLGI
jgi:hypothetical protein